jgi:ribonuclease HIII
MSRDAELARRLKDYWLDPARSDDDALAIVAAALELPPASAVVAGRVLQVLDELEIGEAWRDQVDDLRTHADELVGWRHRADELGDPETPVVKVLEYVGGDEGQLSLPHFDADVLHSARVRADSRAAGAKALLDALGREHLDAGAREAFERAIRDLLDRSGQFPAQALFVEEQGTRGFVLGVQLGLNDSGQRRAFGDVGVAMRQQADVALRRALDDRGCEWRIEWEVPFDGSSIGLALYLAALVATGQRRPDPLLGATGEIDLDGHVRAVSGIAAKLLAAKRAGLRRVLLPAANADDIGHAGDGLDVILVEHVREIAHKLAEVSAAAELEFADRVRIVRRLIPLYGLRVRDERQVANGHRFDVADAAGQALIIVYTGRRGRVLDQGADGSARRKAKQLIADHFPETTVETRPIRQFFVPTQAELKSLREALIDSGGVEEPVNENEDARLTLTRGPSKATAVVYSSGRGILQAGQAPAWDDAAALIDRVLGPVAPFDTDGAAPDASPTAAPPQEPHIGTDESGKGDYFGPLVSAAVFVDEHLASALTDLGVRDSKKLSDKSVRKLAADIKRLARGRYAVTRIGPERFNSLYSAMRDEGKNLNTLLAWGHARSIEDLMAAGIKPRFAVVDQFADARYIEQKILADTRESGIEILQFPKAEADIAVAAASVLARENFLDWLERESARLGVTLPKGASAQVVQAAREIVARFGEAKLAEVAKVSFKTTEKVLAPA